MTSASPQQIDAIMTGLNRGWSGAEGGVVSTFISLLAKVLACETSSLNLGQDVASLRLSIRQIHLRGMDDAICVCIGGSAAQCVDYVRTAMRMHLLPGRVMLVLAFNDRHLSEVRLLNEAQRCVVLDSGAIRTVLEAQSPLAVLAENIRRALPQRALIPYDILRSASGNMFFGRSLEFRRLMEEDMTSFAVTGPGRAGKTSLVKHYLRSIKERSAHGNAAFYIDLMECSPTDADGYAGFIALQIGMRRPDRVDASNFIAKLRGRMEELAQPVTLVLDEGDDLSLDDRTSRMIATAARHGLIRLILCGRGDVFRVMLDPASHFAERLELLRIGPLDEGAARQLLVRPLEDLGVTFSNGDVIERILALTGRLPHLIQLYARRLTELLLGGSSKIVTADHLEELRYDYELSRYVTSPLEDLRDPLARILALNVLRDERTVWKVEELRKFVHNVTVDRIIDISNELVISNILTWHGAAFRLANEAVRMYARDSGYLALAYSEIAGSGTRND